MANGDPARKKRIAELASAISKEHDCDVLLFNYGIEPGFDYFFHEFLKKRATKKKNLVLLLTTEGGDPDTSYRIARRLQDVYSSITIVVAGWCKSAGTLFCISANSLIVCDCGELGPLDIQIAKSDELGERSSGLAVGAAFEKLQEESFRLFISNLTDIKGKIGGRITFRTAADIAAQMVIGATTGIYAKFDPITIGEDHRSNLVAEEYALRLNLKARNLRQDVRTDGLQTLLRGYPSHGFVIDRQEAAKLFLKVSAPKGHILELVDLLGMEIVVPRNTMRNDPIRLEYLNAARPPRSKGKGSSKRGRRQPRGKPVPERANATELRRDISKGAQQEPGPKKAA